MGAVRGAQLLDVVAGRSATGPSDCLDDRPLSGGGIRFGVLDPFGPYRRTSCNTLGHVIQIADPFHLVRLANSKLDQCRLRVQNQTIGHRGIKDDPLYRTRRLLTKMAERLDPAGEHKLMGLLEAGDPHGEVRLAWHTKEVVRQVYQIDGRDLAAESVTQLGADLQDHSCARRCAPSDAPSAAGTTRSSPGIRPGVTNWPTEAVNN